MLIPNIEELEKDTPETLRIFRLAELGKLWVFIDYFHPDTERRVNWRKALNEALTKISLETSDEQFIEIIDEMLAELGDPTTRLRKYESEPTSTEDLKPGFPSSAWNDKSADVLIISMNDPTSFADKKTAIEKLNEIAEIAKPAESVVLDLRSLRGGPENFELCTIFEESNLPRVLSDGVLPNPEQFVRFYYGLEPSDGKTSGGYKKWRKCLDPLARFNKAMESTKSSPAIELTYAIAGTSSKRIVILVNQNTCLSATALALQMRGKAYVISEGFPRAGIAHLVRTIQIPGAGFVDVRLSEFGSHNVSYGGFRPNEIIGNVTKSAILARSLQVLSESRNPDLFNKNFYEPRKTAVNYKRVVAKRLFPKLEDRLFAAFKIWAVFNYFFPYRHLMDSDWNKVLLAALSQAESCRSASEYMCAMTEMLAHTKDTHVWIRGESYYQHFGYADPPFSLRMIENQAVVTHTTGDAEEMGLRLGDVLLAIDCESVEDRMNQFRKYVAASTPQSEENRLLSLILDGPIDSRVTLKVFDGSIEKTIALKRQNRHSGDERYSPPRRTDIIEILPDNIAYVDLTRLQVEQVDEMFIKCVDARAIIFDMRGYPHRTGWPIAARLVSKEKAGKIQKMRGYSFTQVPAATFRCPLNPVEAGSQSSEFTQCVGWSEKAKYKGPTILLIDERAISQSEHTGLHFRAANGTKFVGSATAGANGDITNFAIPGGLKISLTGQSVEHPDGTQLQRVGLVPDVEVMPTIDGIRSGSDEVLERAVQLIFDLEKDSN